MDTDAKNNYRIALPTWLQVGSALVWPGQNLHVWIRIDFYKKE